MVSDTNQWNSLFRQNPPMMMMIMMMMMMMVMVMVMVMVTVTGRAV